MDDFTTDRLRSSGVSDERLKDKNLGKLDLSHQDLSGCDLRGFLLAETNLEGSDLRGADLRTVVFATANCNNVRFCGADLRGANLAFGYFHNADFRGADMRGAILTDSVSNESHFAGADLRGATIGSEVYDSDFRGADLRGIDMPDGLDLDHLACDLRSALTTPGKLERIRNKRKYPRIPLKPPLNVYEQESMRPLGVASDISCAGFRLIGPKSLEIEKEFNIRIAFSDKPGKKPQVLDIVALSVWSGRAGASGLYSAGFSFKKVSDAGLEILNHLINQNPRRKYVIKVDTNSVKSVEVAAPGSCAPPDNTE